MRSDDRDDASDFLGEGSIPVRRGYHDRTRVAAAVDGRRGTTAGLFEV